MRYGCSCCNCCSNHCMPLVAATCGTLGCPWLQLLLSPQPSYVQGTVASPLMRGAAAAGKPAASESFFALILTGFQMLACCRADAARITLRVPCASLQHCLMCLCEERYLMRQMCRHHCSPSCTVCVAVHCPGGTYPERALPKQGPAYRKLFLKTTFYTHIA